MPLRFLNPCCLPYRYTGRYQSVYRYIVQLSRLFRKKYVIRPLNPSESRYNLRMTILGERLKELRKRFNLSQGQLEAYAGVSQSTISDLERGQIAPKTLNAVVHLAKYYNCSTDFLLGLTDDPTPPRGPGLPVYGQELVSVARQLSDQRRLELLRIAETLYELEQEAAEGQPTLIERTLKGIKHGDEARVIGEDSE